MKGLGRAVAFALKVRADSQAICEFARMIDRDLEPRVMARLGHFPCVATGREMDLVLEFTASRHGRWTSGRRRRPSRKRGFHIASDDQGAERRILVYPGWEAWPARGAVEVMPPLGVIDQLEIGWLGRLDAAGAEALAGASRGRHRRANISLRGGSPPSPDARRFRGGRRPPWPDRRERCDR